jgi:hypothetical protein
VADIALMKVVVFMLQGSLVRRACRDVDSMAGVGGIVVLVGDGVGVAVGSIGCFVP